jgi:two-component system response regulator PilR (NtrC family)
VALESEEELHAEIPAERTKAKAAAASAHGGLNFPAEGLDLENYVSDIERSLLQSALRQSNGVQTRAAEMLRLSYRSFRHLMKKYEI